jgi:shikimate dehydrogenase
LKLFAVAGNPILHSRSPKIYAKLFRETDLEAAYFRLAARDAKELASLVRRMGLDGINVTLPFKLDLIPFLDELEAPARDLGAVNCVYRRAGRLVGANTDHIGVDRTIRSHGIDPAGRKAVVFGAGGAARAAVYALVRAGAAKVTIFNRTPDHARKVMPGPAVAVGDPADSAAALKECDICISCIPGPGNPADLRVLKDGCLYMSASYKDAVPPGGSGPVIIDGREWLIYQLGPSFILMTGQAPPDSFPDEEAWQMAAAPPERKAHIALIGFSGSGKTSAGQVLASKMGYPFIDTDAVVESRLGMSIPEIFHRLGEEAFRSAEKEAIARAAADSRPAVIAVGGGAPAGHENADILRRRSVVIWLWIPPGISLGRIEKGTRPLLDHADSPARAEKLLAARIPHYARISDLALSSEGGPAKAIAKRIQNEINQAFGNLR